MPRYCAVASLAPDTPHPVLFSPEMQKGSAEETEVQQERVNRKDRAKMEVVDSLRVGEKDP